MLVSVAVTATDPHHAIEAVFRIEQAKLIAGLARMVRDVGVAEELAQDALVGALRFDFAHVRAKVAGEP